MPVRKETQVPTSWAKLAEATKATTAIALQKEVIFHLKVLLGWLVSLLACLAANLSVTTFFMKGVVAKVFMFTGEISDRLNRKSANEQKCELLLGSVWDCSERCAGHFGFVVAFLLS